MAELAELYSEVKACRMCPLADGRTQAVPGEGPHDADIMVIGEGPGMHEDRQGRPFVGPSGQFLTELLLSAGYAREQVYITNVVKCRPPGNRDPLPAEIDACSAYLTRQIALINPKVIVTVGRFSMARYFPNERISAIHGQARRVNGRVIVAMYHPAAALHQPALRQTLIQDFARLRELIAGAQHQAPKKPQPKPDDDDAAQLKLF